MKTRALQFFHSPKDVAQRFSVSTKTIYRWVDSGALHAHRFGAQLRISEEDIQGFVAAKRR